jgi:hypothetical protein
MQAALDELWKSVDDGVTDLNVQTVATKHGVASSTLYRYKKQGIRQTKKNGRNSVLPDEYECLLAQRIKNSPLGSGGWDALMIKNGARMIYSLYVKSEDAENRAPKFSDVWLSGFCERHGISLHCSVELSQHRLKSTNRLIVMTYLSELSFFIEQHSIPRTNVWTCDETTSIPKGRVTSQGYSAVGNDIFNFKNSIKVPKFSMLCCISASGDSIPPLFLFPCKSESKRRDSVPVIGPPTKMSQSFAWYTATGSMNKEKFALWLETIFAEKIQPFISKSSWTILVMDNCACHFDIPTFKLLLSKKIVVAFFPANSTHWASPLDVSCYQPFKRRLSSVLQRFRSLTNGNLTSWVEPAYSDTFRPELIRKSFQATGIWDPDLNGPSINWIPSQYQELMEDLPNELKKSSYRARRSKALAEGDAKLQELVAQEREKIDGNSKVIAGPKFVKSAMAGKVVSDLTIANISTAAAELQSEDKKKRGDFKTAKESAVRAEKERKILEKEKHQELLCANRKQIKDQAKMIANLQKMLSKAEVASSRLETEKEHLSEAIKVILAHAPIDKSCADAIKHEATERGIPDPILGRRKPFSQPRGGKSKKRSRR